MAQPPQTLKRELGVLGATLMGLGSIVGTGIFVSIAIGADVAGFAVLIAIAIAALVATCNGLNSAQLAANHPVSGGTYEYGYRYLNPRLGFVAGWTFLLAKSASAATAALGFAGYLLNALDADNPDLLVPLALGAVVVFTGIILTGIRRSNLTNTLIVSITLSVLVLFVITGLGSIDGDHFSGMFTGDNTSLSALLQATALMFVAYTGYGRVATLGEEVRDPRRTIPRAIITTLISTMVLYMAVGFVAIGVAGADGLGATLEGDVAPLEATARLFDIAIVPEVVAIGAITAMLGVLLNLILGLSRVLLAMGRRGDMPAFLGKLNQSGTTPTAAVIVMGVVVALLVLVGNVKTTWSFSAFTVLIYYSITNLSALQLPPEERLFPRWLAWVGLGACLFLAFWVQVEIWLFGVVLIVVGLMWQMLMQRFAGST